jgi:N4-gp56 family major capsid protein
MALQTTALGALSAEMKTFYDRVLLTRTVPKLVHTKFGQRRGIPERAGRIIEFRSFAGLAVATTPLTEGVLFTSLKDLTVTAITATVSQYGDAVGFSDLISTTTIDPILTETAEILGEQAGETIDEVVREVIVVGTTVVYAGTATSRGTITTAFTLTPADVLRCALQMELNRARKIDGAWQAITHPRVIFDLMRHQEWRDAQNYNRTGNIFTGEVGELYGVRFWTSDKAKVYTDAGSPGTVDVYTMIVLGQEAFGVVDLAGQNLQTVFQPLGSAGTADPLKVNQTLGWKATFGVKRLQEGFMLRYECSTSTGAN